MRKSSLYQTMLGAWPFHDRERAAFRKRLQRYMVKATREAMVNTKWTRPNVRHERALLHFITVITRESEDNMFLRDFLQVCREIAFYGALNSLAQLLLKITGPGVPDFYQGSELWDLRLVDPDNRGPVDFRRRISLLAELRRQEEQNRLDLIHDLLDHWPDGRIKLFVTSRALTFRRAHRNLYLEGSYQPLQAIGPRRENVFSFVRRSKRAWAITAVSRLVTQAGAPRTVSHGPKLSGRTMRYCPPILHLQNGSNVLTGERVRSRASDTGEPAVAWRSVRPAPGCVASVFVGNRHAPRQRLAGAVLVYALPQPQGLPLPPFVRVHSPSSIKARPCAGRLSVSDAGSPEPIWRISAAGRRPASRRSCCWARDGKLGLPIASQSVSAEA